MGKDREATTTAAMMCREFLGTLPPRSRPQEMPTWRWWRRFAGHWGRGWRRAKRIGFVAVRLCLRANQECKRTLYTQVCTYVSKSLFRIISPKLICERAPRVLRSVYLQISCDVNFSEDETVPAVLKKTSPNCIKQSRFSKIMLGKTSINVGSKFPLKRTPNLS